MIVAPLSILGVWEEEFQKFAAFPYALAVLSGTSAKKLDTLRHMTGTALQVVVVNYESAWRLEKALTAWHPDLIIADVMMPEIDGFEMIRRIRKENKEVPVLFLSARSSTDDIVFGFELGANDYVRKPFSLRELVVRAKALLIKYKQEEGRTEFYEIGLYTFYPKVQTLLIAGESDKLSYKESEILKRLCENEPADLQQGHSAEPMGRRQLL